MRKHFTWLVVGVILVLLAPSASATHGGIHPTFRTEEVFFHCSTPTKVSNIHNVNVTVQGNTVGTGDNPTTWDTNPPAQSAQQGGGCGAIDVAAFREGGEVDAYFRGTFTGNLRDMTLKVHNLLLSRVRTAPDFGVKIALLQIDGETFVENTAVNVTPVVSSTGLSEFVELSITGLGSATEVLDEQGNVVDVITSGLATEDGDGGAVHQITIFLDTDPNQVNSIWVWDATEVPSGIVFNPPTLAAAKIQATPPF